MANNFEQIKSLLGHPIAYYPSLARLTGSLNGGILLSQALYWQNVKGENKEFYKIRNEWEDETYMSHAKQKSAEDAIQKIFAITISKKAIPAKNHYVVHYQKLIELLSKNNLNSEDKNEVQDKDDNFDSENKKNEQDKNINLSSGDKKVESITETSPEISSKTTHNTQDKELPIEVLEAYRHIEKQEPVRNPGGLLHTLLKKYNEGALIPPLVLQSDNINKSIDTEKLRLAASSLVYFKDMIELAKTEDEKKAFKQQLSMAEEQFQLLKKSINE